MTANQPQWPRQWLMTDERMGDRLWQAIDRLPQRDGAVLFRHYNTPPAEREALARRVAAAARERELPLAIAGSAGLARDLGALLVHNPTGDSAGLPFSRSAHSPEEARSAHAAGASLIFLSPLFPTRSHPGRAPLDHDAALEIVAHSPIPVVALGGMDGAKFAQISKLGFYGWAGIDAWLGEART